MSEASKTVDVHIAIPSARRRTVAIVVVDEGGNVRAIDMDIDHADLRLPYAAFAMRYLHPAYHALTDERANYVNTDA